MNFLDFIRKIIVNKSVYDKKNRQIDTDQLQRFSRNNFKKMEHLDTPIGLSPIWYYKDKLTNSIILVNAIKPFSKTNKNT